MESHQLSSFTRTILPQHAQQRSRRDRNHRSPHMNLTLGFQYNEDLIANLMGNIIANRVRVLVHRSLHVARLGQSHTRTTLVTY